MPSEKVEGLRDELREARAELARLHKDGRLKRRIRLAREGDRESERVMDKAEDAKDKAETAAAIRLGIQVHSHGDDFTPDFLEAVEKYLGVTQAEDRDVVMRAARTVAQDIIETDSRVVAARREVGRAERARDRAFERLANLEGDIEYVESQVQTLRKELERAERAYESAKARRKLAPSAEVQRRIRAAQLKEQDLARAAMDLKTIWKVR